MTIAYIQLQVLAIQVASTRAFVISAALGIPSRCDAFFEVEKQRATKQRKVRMISRNAVSPIESVALLLVRCYSALLLR